MGQSPIVFRHTGHFWNDLGVIALWRWMAENAPDGIHKDANGDYAAFFGKTKCVLRSDRLELTDNEGGSHSVLKEAVNALRAQVWQPTKRGKHWWAGPSAFLYAGQNKPDFLVPYQQLPGKSQWRNRGRCDVCGDASSPVRTSGTGYNPLVVTVDKMSSFYSELKGRYQICQSCAFAAPFGLSQAWYSWGDQFLSLTLLWPTGADFLSVDRFLRQTSDLRLTDNVGRNYQQAFNYADSPTPCFLDLFCSLWDTSRTRVSFDVLMMAVAGVQFHAMQLSKPSTRSNVINIDRYEVIPDPAGILRIIHETDQVSQQGKAWNVLASVLNNMVVKQRGIDGRIRADTRLLDQFSRAVVARQPVEDILEWRVYEALEQLQTDPGLVADLNILAFRLFLPIYLKEVKDMIANLVSASKSVGETLGELIKATDDRSILYNLRNSRNADDLLEVLSRVVVRHADTFIEGKPELWRNRVRELAETLDNTNWRRVRSLLGLYAGLNLIELSRKAKGKEPAPTK